MKLNAWLSVLCLLGSTHSARAQSLVEWHLGNANSVFGSSVANAGDIDGDTIPDVLVGASEGGYAWIFAGANGAIIRVVGVGGESFASALCGVGDLDGDGRDDFAVGAATANPGGAVYLYSGIDGGLLRKVVGMSSGESFGRAICRAGDVDGDGHADLAIGAPTSGFGAGQGAVYVYSYAKNAMLRVLTPLAVGVSKFGHTLTNVGDVDDDGIQELAICSSTPDTVGVHSGSTGFVLRTFAGGKQYETGLIGLGPIGASGHEWIAVGSPHENDMGVVRVFDAVTGATVRTLVGTSKSEFGTALGCSGDPNEAAGDHGLIVGAPGDSSRVMIFDAPTGACRAEIAAPESNASFGAAVAGLGSRDGDANGEIGVGAPTYASDWGLMYVFKGPSSCGPIVEHGVGCAGFLGVVPKLHMSGCTLAHQSSSLTMTLEHGPAFATTALLFLGAGNGTMQLPNGCSLAFAQIFGSPIALPLATGMTGPLWPIPSSGIVVPASVPATGFGFTIGMQAVVIDPTVQGGFSTTNAVTMTFLP